MRDSESAKFNRFLAVCDPTGGNSYLINPNYNGFISNEALNPPPIVLIYGPFSASIKAKD